MYNIAIIGGGVAGLSAALTLASTKGAKGFDRDLKILVIDDENSDLNKATLWNVPLATLGKQGKDALKSIKEDVASYENVDFIKDSATKIERDSNIKIETKESGTFISNYLILATGMHKFSIESDELVTLHHDNVPRDGKVKLASNQKQMVMEKIFVAGLLAGEPTMYACASGSGVRAALNVLEEIYGKLVVVHDVADSRR